VNLADNDGSCSLDGQPETPHPRAKAACTGRCAGGSNFLSANVFNGDIGRVAKIDEIEQEVN